MARASIEVITALRNTAASLMMGNDYQWGHMGSCNCGFLAREITQLDKKSIHERAMMRYGDWNEQLTDYCPGSGIPMDDLISELTAFGFSLEDLKHLERLSAPEILRAIPIGKRHLRRNQKEDVIIYLCAWASLLEEKILEKVELSFESRLTETVL